MTAQIKFLEETTARLIIAFDPDTLETEYADDQFGQNEIVDLRDIHFDDGERSFVEFEDGCVSMIDNNKIEVVDDDIGENILPMIVPATATNELQDLPEVDF